jgi:hypothetical protein
MDGTLPCGNAPSLFVIGDDDVVTGDYANSLENKPVSIIFVIVTSSPLMGQVAHDEVEPLGARQPPESPTPANAHSRPKPWRGRSGPPSAGRLILEWECPLSDAEGTPMTEPEWLACENAADMIHFLRNDRRGPALEVRGRKYRLFACACVRHTKGLLGDEISRNAVLVAERLADRQVTGEDIAKARAARVTGAVRKILLRSASQTANDVCRPLGSDPLLATLLRCIFDNPFRPVSLDPAWLSWHDATVPKLAQAVYDDRELPSGHLDTHRLAVLADALEDAGCSDQDILSHCRGPGPHVRGCWVVDLLLGKE